MAQQGSDSSSEEDLAIRSEVSQFRNAHDRMQSLLIRTGGVVPGSVPKIGEQAFVKNRITKFCQTSNSFDDETAFLLTEEPFYDNQSLNQAQLEKLKRQLAEKERNKEKGGSSPSPIGGSFDFGNHASLASKGVGFAPAAAKSLPPKRTEAEAYLLGIIEVRTPLRNLPADRKGKLAQLSVTAIVNETPNISEDGLELGPVIATKKSVSVLMEGQTVSIMVANATGGGVHEMARHFLTKVGVMVHNGQDKVLVYIGHDAMGRRTAVALKLQGVVEYAHVVTHFKLNRKSEEY